MPKKIGFIGPRESNKSVNNTNRCRIPSIKMNLCWGRNESSERKHREAVNDEDGVTALFLRTK
jgi:hypothetical protein